MIRAMILGLVCTAVAGQASAAADDTTSRRSLLGLVGVRVAVAEFEQPRKRAGFDQPTFQTDAELKLRVAGIRVLSQEEWEATPSRPLLWVAIFPTHEASGQVSSYGIDVSLHQAVTLPRFPGWIFPSGVTWTAGGAGAGNLQQVRSHAGDLVDQFINAWLSVNPKK